LEDRGLDAFENRLLDDGGGVVDRRDGRHREDTIRDRGGEAGHRGGGGTRQIERHLQPVRRIGDVFRRREDGGADRLGDQPGAGFRRQIGLAGDRDQLVGENRGRRGRVGSRRRCGLIVRGGGRGHGESGRRQEQKEGRFLAFF